MGCQKHEENSCTIAREFLSGLNYSTQKIAAVEHYIMATERNASPKNISEKIIRDADSSHFAQKSYLETSELLKDELHALKIASYTPKEWQEANIKMFKQEHAYYTDHAKEHWQPKKEKNLKKIIKAKKENKAIIQKEALKAKLKSESPDRGIQTLYRVTLKNHITLSNIADTKANILLSVNAIIISLALSSLIPKLDNPSNSYLIYPTVIFIFFSVISMILAILATRPNVTKEYIYSSLTKDLYFLGLVLHKKYKILRWTYTIFMIGMVASVIAFATAFHYFGPVRV